MKTLEQTVELVDSLNEEAHVESFNDWLLADYEDDPEIAEELRDKASEIQSSYFRDYYYDLDEDDQSSIIHWLHNDYDFYDQLKDYFGHDEFEKEFNYEK